MTRQTSIDVYHQIVEEGLLPRARLAIYETLYRHGPLTANEVMHRLGRGRIGFVSNSAGRFTELRRQGVIYEKRTRDCSMTGREVIEWAVTKNLPIKLEKPIRRKCKTCEGRGYLEVPTSW